MVPLFDWLFDAAGEVLSSLAESIGDIFDGSEIPDVDLDVSDVNVDVPNMSDTGTDTLVTSHHAPQVQFGSTVEFPDGTVVENPNQDAQGYVYPSRRDYLDGTNPHTVDE